MKNRVIYENALRALSQRASDFGNEDFEERAPYIIASFCNEAGEIDSLLRASLGRPAIELYEGVWLSLDEDFPLLDRFASVAVQYLAAMLVIDEDSELSDRLYELYCDGISRIRASLPASLEAISERYFS